jgi:hypothetical protein
MLEIMVPLAGHEEGRNAAIKAFQVWLSQQARY